MKNNVLKIVTLFGVTPLLMGATVLPDLLPSVNVETDYIGPYSYHQSDQTISFTVTFKNYGTVNGVFERIVVETDTYPNAYISKKKVHNIESDSPYTVSFTIPTSELYGDEPMKLTFNVMNASKTYCTRSFSIQPVSSATISPFDYKKNKYELGPFAAKLSGIDITECKETFKFTNYVDYFLNDVYFKIDLDQFNFTFSNNYKNYQFSYKEAYMVINGKKDFFPHLTYNNKEETRIPLKLNKNGGSISLNYKNTMYVHPTLLHMSLSPKEGFAATNNFYLPINHLEDIYGTTISFVLSEVGYSKTTITFNATYLAGDYKLGKCANSEYCVVGGIKG